EQYKSSPNAADVEAEFNNSSTNESPMEISTSGSTISKSSMNINFRLFS
ncbi:unnamed protein product, partial [Rotaria magnacalcarata]